MHEQNLAIAREGGDGRSESSALMQLGLSLLDRGEFDRARDHLDRARSVAVDIGTGSPRRSSS